MDVFHLHFVRFVLYILFVHSPFLQLARGFKHLFVSGNDLWVDVC